MLELNKTKSQRWWYSNVADFSKALWQNVCKPPQDCRRREQTKIWALRHRYSKMSRNDGPKKTPSIPPVSKAYSAFRAQKITAGDGNKKHPPLTKFVDFNTFVQNFGIFTRELLWPAGSEDQLDNEKYFNTTKHREERVQTSSIYKTKPNNDRKGRWGTHATKLFCDTRQCYKIGLKVRFQDIQCLDHPFSSLAPLTLARLALGGAAKMRRSF